MAKKTVDEKLKPSFPKILNGPKGNEASKTVASIEVVNGVTKRETPESLGIVSM